MKLPSAILMLVAALAVSAQADQLTQNVQQALKDQGFYYGEVTGEKDADTTASIRRYQIRNGLQITGDLNDETLKSLGVDSSGVHATVKASPTVAPAQQSAPPDASDLREERRENAGPTNPLTGQPFPEQTQDRQPPVRSDYGAVPGHPAENFAGTPLESAPPQTQRDVIVSAQNILARQGLYRGMIDGIAGPELEFSLRAYQSRVRLPVTGRLDLETLAALQLLPGGNAPIYLPRRRPSREAPVRGEWIPDRN
jgi:peptidoglycan hydrolase-like protein with peptidoglycan-binding domain